MAQIPFKVSARTARLIGRENIASSKGAIIELVKNGYDADSKVSIVYFDNFYTSIPDEITSSQYAFFIEQGISKSLIDRVYEETGNSYQIKTVVDDTDKDAIQHCLKKLSVLYIIDAGEGMNQSIIRNHWMTIGTDNKATDIFTKTGRVKAGAKGIGRFALDKLGSKCEMITIFNPNNHSPDQDENGNLTDNTGYVWKVNWEDFEGEFKTIDKVNAELTGIKSAYIKDEISVRIPSIDFSKINLEKEFKYGTILKITDLRDDWDDFYVEQVYGDLEVLVPPKERNEFEIYLFSSLIPGKYGEVLGSICDDYDYKLVAAADEGKNVKIKIYRNEYDIDIIDPNLFRRKAFSQVPYTRNDFKKGFWEINKTFSQLIPGFEKIDQNKILDKIGAFEFTFYFMKRTYSSPDLAKFNYRKFVANNRKDWLNKYGGIKLFRDNFRVRPYGEVNNSSFDWLALGGRKAKSPAAVSKSEGGYKVEPENVAGTINISRIANIDFEDKSSREGLQENETFQIFKQIILAIITLFEEDRSYIAREMLKFYDEKNSDIKNREEAEKLASAILERRERERKESDTNTNPEEAKYQDEANENKELYILAELNKEKDEIIEKLEDEQKVLRGLASSGIVIASFTHELGHLNDLLGNRIDDLEYLLKDKIPKEDFEKIPDFLNPYVLMENMKKQDLKMQNWLKFSLGAARKDKRTRKKIFLSSYFESLKTTWKSVLENREISFVISDNEEEDIAFRVFEIDLDSIFNNLIVNSIDAFLRHTEIVNRTIRIDYTNHEKEIVIEYFDNGPGLSPDIDKPEKIFDALYTTKRNKHTGEEEGTGLGMWLVNSIINDNDGSKSLLFPDQGFGLRISFPKKY